MPDSLLRDRTESDILRAAEPLPKPRTVTSLALRALDVTVAVLLLALTLPLILLAALAIRLGGRGPILQREARIGRGGHSFHLITFRSTRDGSQVPTSLGRFMRPVRIDQLPVLLNLLRGDMTLVGPAPATGWENAPQAPFSRPGVSGWARAN